MIGIVKRPWFANEFKIFQNTCDIKYLIQKEPLALTNASYNKKRNHINESIRVSFVYYSYSAYCHPVTQWVIRSRSYTSNLYNGTLGISFHDKTRLGAMWKSMDHVTIDVTVDWYNIYVSDLFKKKKKHFNENKTGPVFSSFMSCWHNYRNSILLVLYSFIMLLKCILKYKSKV